MNLSTAFCKFARKVKPILSNRAEVGRQPVNEIEKRPHRIWRIGGAVRLLRARFEMRAENGRETYAGLLVLPGELSGRTTVKPDSFNLAWRDKEGVYTPSCIGNIGRYH